MFRMTGDMFRWPSWALASLTTVALSCSDHPGAHIGAQVGRRSGSLIGGQAATVDALKAVGALIFEDEVGPVVHCTATLTARRVVTTAAHCVRTAPDNVDLWFYLGSHVDQRDSEGQLLAVASATTHPLYEHRIPTTELADLHDLALYQLVEPAAGVEPIDFATREQARVALVVGREVTVVGAGLSDRADPESGGERRSGASQISQVSAWEFRVDGPVAAQKCRGDSGGPTLYAPPGGPKPVLLGVASRAGTNCQRGSSETRIDAHATWLAQAHGPAATSGCSLHQARPTWLFYGLVAPWIARRRRRY